MDSTSIITVQYVVADVSLPVLSVSRLLRLGYDTVLANGDSYIQPSGTACKWPVWMEGNHFYLCPLRRLKPGKRTLYISPVRTERSDYWKLDGETLIRVHVKPRKGLFAPSGVKDLPVRLDQLSPARQTYYTFTTGQTGHLDDVWVLPTTANRALEFSWTGETHFCIEDPTALPTRTVKRLRADTLVDAQASAGDPPFPPGLSPTDMPVDAQASNG